jgi:hypothetical protein
MDLRVGCIPDSVQSQPRGVRRRQSEQVKHQHAANAHADTAHPWIPHAYAQPVALSDSGGQANNNAHALAHSDPDIEHRRSRF